MSKIRHITLPAGFVAAGVKAGIKASGKEDLAIIAGVEDCAAAVLTTQNQVIGEPVRYIRNTLPKGYGVIRGIVINAGCSNVCTGKAGYRDAVTMAADTAGTGCKFTPNTATCNAGNVCTTGDTCSGGTCQAGSSAGACDDGDTCTTDTCDPTNGCTFTAIADGSACDDGNVCTTGEQCALGLKLFDRCCGCKVRGS